MKAAYDAENIRKTLTIVDYENRATIFDAILAMEDFLYKKQAKMERKLTGSSFQFEDSMMRKIELYY